jgi:hypothetical protein
MNDSIRQIREEEFPPLLDEINDPPEKMWAIGNLPDPEDILLQLRTGEGSTDSVSVGGQKVDFNLPPEVEATMASLLSQAQQGDNVARSELGAMVKTIAQDALQANEKNQSR